MEPAGSEESPRVRPVGTSGPVCEAETINVGGGGDGDAEGGAGWSGCSAGEVAPGLLGSLRGH